MENQQQEGEVTKLNNFMLVTEFAKRVGVHPNTIRNLQKKGVITTRRNPLNNRRVFLEEDVTFVQDIVKNLLNEKIKKS